MSYQLESVDDLIAAINAANSASVAKGDFDFSDPKPTAGTWREATGKNTAIQLTAKTTAAFQGSQVFTYDRLNLASLANISGVRVVADNPTSTYSVLSQLSYFTGLKLTTDDVQDLPVTTDGSGNKFVTLTAKSTSKGWYGTVTFQVIPGGAFLDQAVTNKDLPGLNYPNNTAVPGTDTYAESYTYGYDFTSYTPQLVDIVSGALSDANATVLMNALKALDVGVGRTLWSDQSSVTQWSLQGATVVSNGLNSGTVTNPNYKYVMVLTLRAGVTIPTGKLYLHYNDPFNPNDF